MQTIVRILLTLNISTELIARSLVKNAIKLPLHEGLILESDISCHVLRSALDVAGDVAQGRSNAAEDAAVVLRPRSWPRRSLKGALARRGCLWRDLIFRYISWESTLWWEWLASSLGRRRWSSPVSWWWWWTSLQQWSSSWRWWRDRIPALLRWPRNPGVLWTLTKLWRNFTLSKLYSFTIFLLLLLLVFLSKVLRNNAGGINDEGSFFRVRFDNVGMLDRRCGCFAFLFLLFFILVIVAGLRFPDVGLVDVIVDGVGPVVCAHSLLDYVNAIAGLVNLRKMVNARLEVNINDRNCYCSCCYCLRLTDKNRPRN